MTASLSLQFMTKNAHLCIDRVIEGLCLEALAGKKHKGICVANLAVNVGLGV
jgi:hypothetical protein